MNNVECQVCHNLGHVAARCRSRMIQDCHIRSSHFRYFKGYCFACNMFGHKAIDCYRKNMKHVRFYECNRFGHKVRECRRKIRTPKQEDHKSSLLALLCSQDSLWLETGLIRLVVLKRIQGIHRSVQNPLKDNSKSNHRKRKALGRAEIHCREAQIL